MFTGLLLTALAAAPAQAPARPAASLTLLGNERWYQQVKGDEETFVGVLERIPASARDQRSAYRLAMTTDGRPTYREVFIGSDSRALAPYVGQKVRLVGMTVDLKVDGRTRYEIWPARLETGDEKPEGMRVLARTAWTAKFDPKVIKAGAGAEQVVLRSPEELLKAAGSRAEAEAILRALNIKDMDWKNQMLIGVTGGVQPNTGYSVEITGLDVRDKTLTVQWRLNKPGPKDLVTVKFIHPAEILLVPSFDGPVRFDLKK